MPLGQEEKKRKESRFQKKKMVSIAPPAAILAALQAAVSADAQYTFFRCPSGVYNSASALIGTAGGIQVYLIPVNSSIVAGNTMPSGVTGAGLNSSVTLVTDNAAATGVLQAAVATFMNNSSGTSIFKLGGSQFGKSSTEATYSVSGDNVGLLLLMPGGFSQTPASTPTTSPWVYVAVAVALVGGGGLAWMYLRKTTIKKNPQEE